jgi:hypothetical protein
MPERQIGIPAPALPPGAARPAFRGTRRAPELSVPGATLSRTKVRFLEVVVSAADVAALPVHTRAPLEGMSTGDLETELLGLAGHIAAAQCRFLRLLAEFDRRDGWAGPGVRSCAHWLSWRAGMSLRTAAEHVRVAHALEKMPRITEAFAVGRISYSKVRAITRISGADTTCLAGIAAAGSTGSGPGDPDAPARSAEPERPDGSAHLPADPAVSGPGAVDPSAAEQVLLNLALSGTAGHVETVVRAVRRRCTPPEDIAARRGLSWHWDQDGSLVLRGRLAPDEGAALIAAIETNLPPREPVRHPVPEPPHDWSQRAVEQEPGPADDRVAARRADALVALATATTDEKESAPIVARGNAQVVVHLDVSAGTGIGAARIPGGPELSPNTAERLACDARVQLLLSDRRNNRLYLGRSRRLATPAQIAALTVRDEARCQFPGCTHTRYLHAHHVRPWWQGGRTDIDNLVLTCSFHHRLIHDHGYRIRRGPDGWEFRRPDGSPVPASAAPLAGNVEGLIEIATREGLRIGRDTLTPTWAGERLDPEPILDTLLPRHPQAAA